MERNYGKARKTLVSDTPSTRARRLILHPHSVANPWCAVLPTVWVQLGESPASETDAADAGTIRFPAGTTDGVIERSRTVRVPSQNFRGFRTAFPV